MAVELVKEWPYRYPNPYGMHYSSVTQMHTASTANHERMEDLEAQHQFDHLCLMLKFRCSATAWLCLPHLHLLGMEW